ncbi:MAG: division plane positioning ATPase MipZ [Pseudomonadota bacterium]
MSQPAHVIVIGNEKGGSGKSTTSMHIFVALARAGFSVGAIDLDTRQKSFFRYLENRKRKKEKEGYSDRQVPMPLMREVSLSDNIDRDIAEQEELERFTNAVSEMYNSCDFIIIDCPGTDSYLSRLGHAAADKIITPMNDSFIDFDLLAQYDPEREEVIGPSLYADMVWECRRLRSESQLPPLDWIVMRNRYNPAMERAKFSVSGPLKKLATRIGFRVAAGFAERMIYRDLFLAGLTVLDVDNPPDEAGRESYTAARREIAELVEQLELPGYQPANPASASG